MVASSPFLCPSRLRRSLVRSRETRLTRPNRTACFLFKDREPQKPYPIPRHVPIQRLYSAYMGVPPPPSPVRVMMTVERGLTRISLRRLENDVTALLKFVTPRVRFGE